MRNMRHRMKPALVKWTVDLLAPGAIITSKLANYYLGWRAFHSRRILYPVMDEQLMDVQEDGAKALVDFSHIRITSIMDNWDGITDGPLDRLLTLYRIDDLFDLSVVQGIALQVAPPYHLNKTRASWIGLYGVEEEKVHFLQQTTVHDITSLILKDKAPTE